LGALVVRRVLRETNWRIVAIMGLIWLRWRNLGVLIILRLLLLGIVIVLRLWGQVLRRVLGRVLVVVVGRYSIVWSIGTISYINDPERYSPHGNWV